MRGPSLISRGWAAVGAVAVGMVGTTAAVEAAEPVLTHMFPAGVERGKSTEVTMIGKFDPWPCQIWSANPGVSWVPGTDPGKVTVTVAAEVAAGPQLVRAFNAEGASAPVALVVTTTPEMMEVEPNDDHRFPQEIPLPGTTINGRHEKGGDIDCFGISLARGQVVVAWMEAHVLAAGMDSMLRILNEQGVTLAFNHDHITLDPFLAFTAPRDGRYIIQTMGHAYPASSDIRFAGGPTCVYRLHVTTDPVVRNTWPLAVGRGCAREVRLEGWNLIEDHRTVDAESGPADVPVIWSDHLEVIEGEHDDPLALPVAISGRIQSAGQNDSYAFQATKDSVLEITVSGRSLGSAIDPWVKIHAPDGKEIATNDDDRGTVDSRLIWTVPDDGVFTAVVGDVTRRGGENYFYRLRLAPVTPSVTGTAAAHAVKVEAGQSAEIKVTVTIAHGFKEKLVLAAGDGLPSGVTAEGVEVPEAGGEVTMVVAATPAAEAAGRPIRLVLRESDSGHEHSVMFPLAAGGEDNGVPQGFQKLLVNATADLWLTVVPTAAPAEDATETPAENPPATN